MFLWRPRTGKGKHKKHKRKAQDATQVQVAVHGDLFQAAIVTAAVLQSSLWLSFFECVLQDATQSSKTEKQELEDEGKDGKD